MRNNLCYGYNSRLPAFLMERYASCGLKKTGKQNIYLMQEWENLFFLIRLTNILIQLKCLLHSECIPLYMTTSKKKYNEL